jgi:MFS family permease
MVENERIVKARKKNMKLYPLYRMIGSDIVFLYAIRIMFLTQVKHINAHDIVLASSMYALFMIILQVPITILIEKIGYKKSTFISNIFNAIYITVLMFCENVWWLIINEFISAISFSLKSVAEPSLLSISIPQAESKGNIYSKLEGKGNSKYNLLNGVANIVSGAVYIINPYLPIILSASCAIIGCIISLQFEEIENVSDKKENIAKNYINDMKVSFKFILQSKRLKCLLLYSGLIWGIHCLVSEYKDTLLVEIGASSLIIGTVGAIFGVIAAVASKRQVQFHNRFKNKSLSYIAISFTIGIIISGVVVILNAPFILELVVIVIGIGTAIASKAMTLVLINRYLANFSNQEILPKIYSANSIIKNILRMVFGILGSLLMARTGSANAMAIVGVISFIIMILLLKAMKTRVGLKPEEYKKEEIEFKVLH